MENRYIRKLSFNDRIFVVADKLYPPLANQFVAEGKGVLDLKLWKSAVAAASAANPGSRLVLKGFLWNSRWVDSGITPPVIEVDQGSWDWNKPETVPYFNRPLCPRKGPTCEILLVKGDPLRIIYRTHHAVMDGRGTVLWLDDIYRALRGEPCVGSHSTINDSELAHSFQKGLRKPYPTEHIAPTGKAEGFESGVITRRFRLKGKYHNLLAQVALEVAREAWSHSDGVVRFAIPVDMRFRMPDLISTGNLTYAIYIEIKKDSTPEQITEEITRQIIEKREGMLSRGDEMARYIPLWILSKLAKRVIERRHRNGIYSISGIVSNLGKLKRETYIGGGFEPTAFWGIPPVNDYVPFFIGLAGYDDRIELVLSLPRRMATGNRIDGLLERISDSLK